MLFIEYTENDTQMALNVALCHHIEVYKHETGSISTFCIKFHHQKGQLNISFKTEEHLDKAFESLMKAIQDPETRHWGVPTED